jgi:NAD(P)-dependent dehydrogenase (short-subunit alcohol dehydrogenase family)
LRANFGGADPAAWRAVNLTTEEVTMGRLAGKVALVTGGNTGIGEAIARLFAKEGAKVVIAARRADAGEAVAESIRADGGEARFVSADITRADDCRRMVAETLTAFGALHVAANNAGIGRAGKLVADIDEADWDAVMDVNLKGAFLSMKAEIPAMVQSGGGAIVNTSSIGGLIASQGQAAYQASKHGLQGLTKAAALEYATKGVRVNSINPGPVRTEMVRRWFAMPGVEEKILASIPPGVSLSPGRSRRPCSTWRRTMPHS